jgi:hypothetical protein
MTASSLGSVQSNTLSNMNLLLLWPQEPSSIQLVDIRNTIAGHMNRDELVQIDVQNGVQDLYLCDTQARHYTSHWPDFHSRLRATPPSGL